MTTPPSRLDPLAERDLRRALELHLPWPLVTGTALEVADAGADRLQVTLPRAAFDMLLRLAEWDFCDRDHLDDADTAELLDQLAENGPLTDAERAALKAVLDAER